MLKKIEIPIIEKDDEGYWEVYKDAQNHIIKKVWHQNTMGNLQQLYDKQKEDRKSNFISLDDGESFEGEFVGVEETTGQFGETNQFTFIVNGEQKILNSKSFGLLKGMAKTAKEGDKVKITKTGAGFKTKFQVEKLS